MKHTYVDIPQSIIDHLDHLYPSVPPRLADTDREVWFKAGQRAVVDALIELKRKQDERTSVLTPKESDIHVR